MNLDVVEAFRSEQMPRSWSFWFFVPDAFLRPVWLACLAVLVAFTLGLWSRSTAVLAWIIAVSTARRAPISLHGFDDVLSTWLLYLAVTGASGQAVSLDRFLARWRQNRAEVAQRRKDGRWTGPTGVPTPTVSANIGLRLIQCHLMLIYGMSGLSKFMDVGWWNGTAIWGTIASGEVPPLRPDLAGGLSLGLERGHPRRALPRDGLPGPDLDQAAPTAGPARGGGDAPGDRPDAGARRVQPGDARGEPGVRLRPLAPEPGRRAGPAQRQGPLRRGLPALSGLDGLHHGRATPTGSSSRST